MQETQMLKGVLDLAVLSILTRGETYGYDILSRLEDAGLTLGDASVYGTLRRLEEAGHLTSRLASSENGPARKYYSVTGTGRAAYAAGIESWQRITGAVRVLMQERSA